MLERYAVAHESRVAAVYAAYPLPTGRIFATFFRRADYAAERVACFESERALSGIGIYICHRATTGNCSPKNGRKPYPSCPISTTRFAFYYAFEFVVGGKNNWFFEVRHQSEMFGYVLGPGFLNMRLRGNLSLWFRGLGLLLLLAFLFLHAPSRYLLLCPEGFEGCPSDSGLWGSGRVFYVFVLGFRMVLSAAFLR